MSWLVPFYIGVLYFCFGLAILNAGVFNNGLGYTTTDTVMVSTLVLQPIPTGFVAGYLPYKPSASSWLDIMETVSIEEDSRGRKGQKQQGADTGYKRRYANANDIPSCQPGMKSCRDLGHPVCSPPLYF